MRKSVIFVVFAMFFGYQIQAQTSGTLSVAVTTSSAGGSYAPRNIIAIWVEDNSGKFIKTLLAYANTRRTHLNNWETTTTTAGSAFNTVDAVSGATQSNHGTRTCSWNSTDFSGKQVPDGDYKLKMELTDKNSTGNIATFNFTKGSATQKYTPVSVPSFSAITINWTTVTNIQQKNINSEVFSIVPNPGTGIFRVLGEGVKQVSIRSLTGKLILQTNHLEFDISACTNGIYFVAIESDQETIVKKIIKQ